MSQRECYLYKFAKFTAESLIKIKRQQQKGETIPKAMYKPNWKLEKLRSSQRFLAKEEPLSPPFRFCCCDEEQLVNEDVLLPALSASPQPKISIKKMKRLSPNGCNHTNSDFSLSKQSQRSNIPISKKATQTHIVTCPHCQPQPFQRPLVQSHASNITFLYSNRHPQNNSNNYNAKPPTTHEKKLQPAPARHPQYAAKPKPIDQSIQIQFKNILDFGDAKEEYNYGEAFPFQSNDHPPKVRTAYQTMPNFSFGQNQKEQFMSKYLNVKQDTSLQKVAISSKENSNKAEIMKEIIEERFSKSSKSSGRVFVRGTFNKNNLNSLAKKRDFMYKSQSEISLQSSQSLVIESYQNIMRKRESFIREYQY